MENCKRLGIGDIILPNQVFFNPSEEFIRWFSKELKGKFGVEIGAGVGLLSRKLRDNGVNIIGIDQVRREETDSFVLIADATEFDYKNFDFAIIARPCRGDWIHDSINRASESVNTVYYIGIQPHYNEDIQSLVDYKIHWAYSGAGEENEYVIKIQKRGCKEEKLMKTFCLLKMYSQSKPFWWEKRENTFRNENGGYFDIRGTEEILDTAEAEDWEDLDYLKCGILVPGSPFGWLDPNGIFFGCNYANHDRLAEKILKETTGKLERKGWVRVVGVEMGDYYHDSFLTAEQRNWLSLTGRLSEEDAGIV